MNFIILFAPKFKGFGVDLFKAILEKNNDARVIALCTGGSSVVDYVKSKIESDKLISIYDIEKEELVWLKNSLISNNPKHSSIDAVYGIGTMGEVITSDRRVGLGMVRGGVTRPDLIGDAAVKHPTTFPIDYVNSLFLFLEEIFRKHEIDCSFCYAVAGAPAVALAKICNKNKITFLTFNTTRISDRYIIDTDYKGRLKRVENRYKNTESNISDKTLNSARKYLHAYREKPADPDYMNYNKALLKKNKILSLSKRSIVYFFAFFIKGFLSKKYNKKISHVKLRRVFFDLKIELKKTFLNKDVFDSILENRKSFYFPLHVDPEASTMVMSPMHTDQLSIIESLSKGLPDNAILLVKEHLPMLGRRPKGFYQTLNKIPRVKLVSPYIDSREIIKRSEASIVITGTAALESILLNRKSLVIGSSPYLAIGTGIIYEPCLSNFSKALSVLENAPPPDSKKIIKYLACAFDESFSMKTSLLWGEYENHSNKERETILKEIIPRILNLVVKK